ncbi:ParA family protein [Paracoccaceae bacterium GXU_MW_L88]
MGHETKIFAIANQKGGVGKTTTAINLGTALAVFGRRVLLIDLDPQGNASTGLGVSYDDRTATSYDLIVDSVPLKEIIRESSVPGLSIAPSNSDLSSADMALVSEKGRLFRLKTALDLYDGEKFDYVLIDCPPSLNLLTLNSLVAASDVIVPLQCEFFALEGLSQLMQTIKEIRDGLNPGLRIQGIVLTMYDRRNNLSEMVEKDVRSNLGRLVFETIIPRNVRLSEAPSHALPALIYDHKSTGSIAYQKLAAELLNRVGDAEELEERTGS